MVIEHKGPNSFICRAYPSSEYHACYNKRNAETLPSCEIKCRAVVLIVYFLASTLFGKFALSLSLQAKSIDSGKLAGGDLRSFGSYRIPLESQPRYIRKLVISWCQTRGLRCTCRCLLLLWNTVFGNSMECAKTSRMFCIGSRDPLILVTTTVQYFCMPSRHLLVVSRNLHAPPDSRI